jgi:ribonuclease HII
MLAPMAIREATRLRRRDMQERERELAEAGFRRVAGADEAGVGPLAGPLVAAAVHFPPGIFLEGVDDSKKLSPARRETMEAEIRAVALGFSIVAVDPEEIDRVNVYQAGLLAMSRAVAALRPDPDYLLVDAREVENACCPQEAWIKGDSRCHAIAAASILAKTARDRMMRKFDERFPGYGFSQHKGYPTVSHREAIAKLGPCPIHRQSFTLLPR